MPTPTPARHMPYARGSIFRKYPLNIMMEEKEIRFIPIPVVNKSDAYLKSNHMLVLNT